MKFEDEIDFSPELVKGKSLEKFMEEMNGEGYAHIYPGKDRQAKLTEVYDTLKKAGEVEQPKAAPVASIAPAMIITPQNVVAEPKQEESKKNGKK